ncbi:hypothetical protein [Roseinatronobacter sp.]|uniref:hypothetical protein n=1 Tax=Roseinatronobacter sp. TaxID=1945755 RepID=UPI0025D491F4|nr:hypothetical protein [Rhodobaca sp.]
MRQKSRLQKLGHLADMVRDHELAKLNRLAAAQGQTREKLANLPTHTRANQDPALMSIQQAHLQWAAKQRMQLNLILARQRAALLEQRRKSARSFGRAEAVARLIERDSTKP